MDKDEIYGRVIEIVADSLDIEEGDLGEDTDFRSLGADSFDLLEVVTALEDEFGASLEDDDLSSIETVMDAVDAIMRVI